MSQAVLQAAGESRLALSGVVDLHSGKALRLQADQMIASFAGKQIELDCTGLAEGSSSVCLSLLLCIQRDARARGMSLSISGLPEEMRRIAGMYGLLEILPLSA